MTTARRRDDAIKQLASSGGVTSVSLWDTSKKKTLPTLEAHTEELGSVDYCYVGRTLASGSKDTLINLWDPTTGKLLRTLTGHKGRVESLAFSPDGKTLATGGGGGDTSVRLWDLTKK